MHSADPSTRLAPAPKARPPGWTEAIRAMPAKLTSVPAQPRAPKRSPSTSRASSAVRIGAVLTMKLAAPAATLRCPVFSRML
jgi:hypothetical protein